MRLVGRAWVPITMEIIQDGIYDPRWYDQLETFGFAYIVGGCIIDTQHPDYDESWLEEAKV